MAWPGLAWHGLAWHDRDWQTLDALAAIGFPILVWLASASVFASRNAARRERNLAEFAQAIVGTSAPPTSGLHWAWKGRGKEIRRSIYDSDGPIFSVSVQKH